MNCWKCRALLETEKISFRAVCDQCGSYLHCCKGCRFHAPGRNNECMIPGTDLIVDREAGNFCEDFLIKQDLQKNEQVDPLSRARKLFGEDIEIPKRSFDDLFGD
ncbi:MAG: hypothetical protein JHC93_00780 [Parachlamydiales bacterium]|nr:hypothetical protein [Parachlamydiales bacterium]